ncbi:ribulose-phosphate 3-epimerase [Listeria booriae]|uniref:ribulose-phosphate 3-epimerase n=1 Tax=Listeria booriae TaxID=1552123 RepID=A0A841Y1Y2_9LIST|nr:ribulose-phosphate 3-epimerase [Listeria booriae]MBC1317930.1 ribulose-phosphate 3-epimerase [Listeria booriae]
MATLIAASIMCADQLNVADELAKLEAAGVDMLHCDVMDGIYVNNLAIGPEWLTTVKNATNIPLDIHLATINPIKYIDLFAPIKPEYISFHVEVCEDIPAVIQKIRSYHIKPAIALNPETPLKAILPYLNDVEMVLMMTVNPGFAGQNFQDAVLEKLYELKELLKNNAYAPLIEVDGNINATTIGKMSDCLPDVFVLGTSALFHRNDNKTYSERIVQIWSQVKR